jgi:hypothetical protein
MIVPGETSHWQLNICTTSPRVNHVVGLYGPDKSRGVRTERGYEYVLQGSGELWRNEALRIDPQGGGAIVVFLNTNDLQPRSGYKTAHYIVPDPRIETAVEQEWIRKK